jgi:hypothetical protein
MEDALQCLVGANVYVTPAGSQGLAPHWDDVDVFVAQLDGAKTWLLWPAPPGAAPPVSYSADLRVDALGTPRYAVTLFPGDCLFLPRGTIHCARACDHSVSGRSSSAGSVSVHVTLSVHQNAHMGAFLQHALDAATAQPSGKHLRQTLSGVLVHACGTGSDLNAPGRVQQRAQACQAAAASLSELARTVEQWIDAAADEAAVDFFRSRLPPYTSPLHAHLRRISGGHQLSLLAGSLCCASENGADLPAFSPQSRLREPNACVRVRYPSWMRMFVGSERKIRQLLRLDDKDNHADGDEVERDPLKAVTDAHDEQAPAPRLRHAVDFVSGHGGDCVGLIVAVGNSRLFHMIDDRELLREAEAEAQAEEEEDGDDEEEDGSDDAGDDDGEYEDVDSDDEIQQVIKQQAPRDERERWDIEGDKGLSTASFTLDMDILPIVQRLLHVPSEWIAVADAEAAHPLAFSLLEALEALGALDVQSRPSKKTDTDRSSTTGKRLPGDEQLKKVAGAGDRPAKMARKK